MKMGFFSRKRSTVKLVHPGGFAEIRKTPTTAAQVMQNNPRHCVTRPDVFKFPWIVVHPESILKPGNVFFIVPYRTIHCLRRVRTNRSLTPTTLPQQDSLLDYDKARPTESLSDERQYWVPTSHAQYRFPSNLQDIDCLESVDMEHCHQLLMGRFPDHTVERRAKVDCRLEDGHEVAIFPKGLVDLDKHSLHDHQCVNSFDDSDLSSQHIGRLELGHHEESKKLKSCLKKNNFSKVHGCRVRFDLPDDDDKNKNFHFQDF